MELNGRWNGEELKVFSKFKFIVRNMQRLIHSFFSKPIFGHEYLNGYFKITKLSVATLYVYAKIVESKNVRFARAKIILAN